MVLHTFVDVQDGAAWRIESGEEFIDDDQELHGGGLGFEATFNEIFVGFGFGFVGLGADVLEDLGVEVVDKFFVGFSVGSRVFGCDVFGLWIVGGDDRAFAFKACLGALE
jgi:hypothetical protein